MIESQLQDQFDVAVVVPTTLRQSLTRSILSIFNQSHKGRIQILIGVDKRNGDDSQLEKLKQICPDNIALTIVDLGYSTSKRHGGFYPNAYSGAIRTILSYAANSKYVAYLDDDDWWRADHIKELLNAIHGKDWAFSLRWFADKETGWLICKDEWDSLGPEKGINLERFGGFISPSNLMLNKNACHFVFPCWSLSPFEDGTGEDRIVFNELLKLKNYAGSNEYSCFYTIPEDVQHHEHHKKEFDQRGIGWIYQRAEIPSFQKLERTILFDIEAQKMPSKDLVDSLLSFSQYSIPALISKTQFARPNDDLEDLSKCLKNLNEILGPELKLSSCDFDLSLLSKRG
jgi:hypothetical protein